MADGCGWIGREGEVELSARHRPLSADEAPFAGNGYRAWPEYQKPRVWLSLHRMDAEKNPASKQN
jgi:hypothetical protein